MQYLKTDKEISLMRQAGLLVWQAHEIAAEHVKPGVTTAEINAAVEQFITEHKATPLFKGVPSSNGKVPFPAVTCISVNEQIVHGIPGSRALREGDIVSIDIGIKQHGWCGDAAVTRPVGKIAPKVQRLLDITEGTLKLAIELIPQSRLWSQVARELEEYVKSAKFSVVEGLVGHGVGREMWETPQVPNYYTKQYEQLADFELKPGVVIAVEPMVNMGAKRMRMLGDAWTIVTHDGLPSAHFEHTLAITKKGVQVLTAGPDGKAWATV
ncbi:type I methionyl aminopeptidase [Ktedonosporobacter rubrisoli]|uniref:Methionine aminopeptidase n=1 Tax=Ktedonosporobacter rubrisoli TaxID=2509675 RepID=A0A4P6K0K9_KTERU|nr:type I methionyl aminopeptidase [Ktedonosporobacter rubrisoli]QBD81160.1 type I methionyl aminopeptidase [Ktedonosporobacter rubrisoli]